MEFAGYDGIAGPEMRRLLASLGLRGTGSHIAYDALRDDLDGCVRYCLEAGITSAACPGCEMNDRDQALAQAEFLEACAERFGAEGIPFAYHNHAHEFADAGNGETLFDVLLHNTSKLGAELDVFWAAYAGVDPLAFIQTYAGGCRCSILRSSARKTPTWSWGGDVSTSRRWPGQGWPRGRGSSLWSRSSTPCRRRRASGWTRPTCRR